jgi:hypothetical protein
LMESDIYSIKDCSDDLERLSPAPCHPLSISWRCTPQPVCIPAPLSRNISVLDYLIMLRQL